MKKKYFSPSLKIVRIDYLAQLLGASKGINFDIDGNDAEITDGGITSPDENYNPW